MNDYDKIMALARRSLAEPPYGREPPRRYTIRGVEHVEDSGYRPGNLASNAFVLGLLTAARIVRGEES